MYPQHLFILQKQHLWLCTERCIFWEEENTLIVSDIHFAKSGHFRKNGIAIPQQSFKEDLQRFLNLITYFKSSKVIVVGDLFHSSANTELDLFLKLRNDFNSIEIHLVKGNHDILKADWYNEANIIVHPKRLNINNFSFVHDIEDIDKNDDNLYTFSGHLHPSIEIKVGVRQSSKFPCFHFGKQNAILPAFGKFTGTAKIKRLKSDSVFAIVNDRILEF